MKLKKEKFFIAAGIAIAVPCVGTAAGLIYYFFFPDKKKSAPPAT